MIAVTMSVISSTTTTKTPPSAALLRLISPPQRTPAVTFLTKARKLSLATPPKSVAEDKQDQPPTAPADADPYLLDQSAEEEQKIDPRRLEEKFAVVNTGVFECRSCGYKYDEAAGDPSYPIPPGLPFDKLPEDWRCPTCGASQNFFESKRVEIAGFAENQQFGLGGNALTSGQKLGLIYGGLFLGFLFFLSGYFLQ